MAEGWRDFLSATAEHRAEVDEYRELDPNRVLVIFHLSGRGKTSGLDLSRMRAKVATLFQLRDGKVTRLVNYVDSERALADVGVARNEPSL